jgi:plasmid maintenance system antidote protein VapI
MPAERFHPSEFIKDEMKARGWSMGYLASLMSGDFQENFLALDLYFHVHDENLRMGQDVIDDFAKIFGVSKEFFQNLENMWVSHRIAIREGGKDD